MAIVIESVILCLLFTLMVYIITRVPINTLYNYPPKIIERVKSLDEYKDKVPTQKNKIATKLTAALIVVFVFSLILKHINGYTTFKEGFIYSYLLWTIINAFDAFIIDILWFCHDPYFVFKGTEDMIDEYHNYGFHIKQSLIGQIIAIPVCLLIGLVIQFVI